jgi:hypothetical protein
VLTTARLDQAVDSVTRGAGDTTLVHLSNRGQMVLPLTLELRYADGTSDTRQLPVEMWYLGSRFTYRMNTAKQITGVAVDPRQVYPDIDRRNNSWTR